MMFVNVFPIDNTDELSCHYKTFRVRGLLEESEDFERNLESLCSQLSRETKSPFAPWREEGSWYVVQPEGGKPPPDRVELVRTVAHVEPTGIRRRLDFDNFDENEAALIIRFLTFYLQDPLFRNPNLWQPSAGQPFFQKTPAEGTNTPRTKVEVYPGFKVRAIILPGNQLGICVGVTHKYVARNPLPIHITREHARRLRGRRAVYEWGKDWYEIQIDALSDLNVSELHLPGEGTLYDHHITTKGRRERVQRAMAVPKDCSVLTYRTGLGAVRNVPSTLCRLTYTTDHDAVRGLHRVSIVPPHVRRYAIERVVRDYFSKLPFLDKTLRIQPTMLQVDERSASPPRLAFGQGATLEINPSSRDGGLLSNLGPGKRDLLLSPRAGFYSSGTLGRQYLFMPKSMYETIGEAYVADLKDDFQRLYGHRAEQEYEPVVIEYDDDLRPTIHNIGDSILRAAKKVAKTPGHALVVLPSIDTRGRGKEDELANLVVNRLWKEGIKAACSHMDVPHASYCRIDQRGEAIWVSTNDDRTRSRYRGYLENLVLNKILLNNSCWPFILADKLYADLVLGIDVKGSTAGFTLIPGQGDAFAFKPSQSQQHERLAQPHIRKRVGEFLREYLRDQAIPVRHLVVHRDGKMYGSEVRGLKEAVNDLRQEGLVDPDAKLTLVEIQKTSRAPVRFFHAHRREGTWKERTDNPRVGTYMPTTEGAILCTTGLPYRFPGTTKPIQVRIVEGAMPLEQVISDVFALANLTWTKVDSCSRLPLSIKWTDIRLREAAGEFDEDMADFGEEETSQLEEDVSVG